MHARRRSSGTAVVVAILLVGVGMAGAWLAMAPAIFGPSLAPFEGALPSAQVAAATEANASALMEGLVVNSNIQVSQPRDPFRPLITSESNAGGPGSGQRTGIEVFLVSVSPDAPYTAIVSVNSVEYTVGVGDTFAGSFKVISLTPPNEALADTDPRRDGYGVFLFGDNAFELGTGQQILK